MYFWEIPRSTERTVTTSYANSQYNVLRRSSYNLICRIGQLSIKRSEPVDRKQRRARYSQIIHSWPHVDHGPDTRRPCRTKNHDASPPRLMSDVDDQCRQQQDITHQLQPFQLLNHLRTSVTTFSGVVYTSNTKQHESSVLTESHKAPSHRDFLDRYPRVQVTDSHILHLSQSRQIVSGLVPVFGSVTPRNVKFLWTQCPSGQFCTFGCTVL